MKIITEVTHELNRLKCIVQTAKGIDREDCPELSAKIAALQWVLNMKDDIGSTIQLDMMIL